MEWTCGSHQPVDSFCRPCVSGCPSAPPPPPPNDNLAGYPPPQPPKWSDDWSAVELTWGSHEPVDGVFASLAFLAACQWLIRGCMLRWRRRWRRRFRDTILFFSCRQNKRLHGYTTWGCQVRVAACGWGVGVGATNSATQFSPFAGDKSNSSMFLTAW